MKSLRLRRMLVAAPSEQKARQLEFDASLTVLLGPNNAGKSSLIKTLFMTFGATPSKVNAEWQALNVHSLVHFDVDDTPYAMVRAAGRYGLFEGQRLLVATSKVAELAPHLASIWDFKLTLSSRTSDAVAPPPAFYFLPFYIDQDGGWNQTWSSFDRLRQFSNWKKDVAEYHTGIFPNDFYVAKATKGNLESKLQEPLARQRLLQQLSRELDRRYQDVGFSVDFTEFQLVIGELLKRAETVKHLQDAYRTKLVGLRSSRDEVVAQQAIVKRTRSELARDYEFATELDDDVSCPTCGTLYHNGVAERFGLSHDESQCTTMLAELKSSLDSIDAEIALENANLAEARIEFFELDEMLAAKKGDVTLRQLIENEGRRGMRGILADDIEQAGREINEKQAQIDALGERMKLFRDGERRRGIVAEYAALVETFSSALNVKHIPSAVRKSIAPSLTNTTGSDLPRTLLAYQVAIWHVIAKYGSSAAFPMLVVDAINQQEQDEANIKRMLTLLRDKRPMGSQCIVGLVDTHGVSMGGTTIELTEKYAALRRAQYDSTNEEIRSYLRQME
jgi:hypothetical protein